MQLVYKNEDGSSLVMYDTVTNCCEIFRLVSHEGWIGERKERAEAMPVITKPIIAEHIGIGRGKGKKTCAICKEQGHLAKTCPKRQVGTIGVDYGQSEGVYRKNVTGEDIVRIQALKDEGKKSHEVAEILRIHLAAVNKHWVD